VFCIALGSFSLAALLYFVGWHDLAAPAGLAIGTTAAMAVGYYWIE
jgi:hypothetical protein